MLTPSRTCLVHRQTAPTCGQLQTTLRNRWKWLPEDFPLLALYQPSPVGRALHLWMSLQCLSPHKSSLPSLEACLASLWVLLGLVGSSHIVLAWPNSQLWHHLTCCTTNFSKSCRSLSLTAEWHSLSAANVFETSSHASHVLKAHFFDYSWKDDTMSQPLKAWKKRISRVFSDPMAETTSCIVIHLVFPPLPKATNILTWSHQPKPRMDGSVALSAKAAAASFSIAEWLFWSTVRSAPQLC